MVTRHDRRMLRVALVSFCLASTEGLCLLGERHTPKRHRQRQHQRRHQQRNALFHLLTSSPFSLSLYHQNWPLSKDHNDPCWRSRLHHWLPLPQVPIFWDEVLSLYQAEFLSTLATLRVLSRKFCALEHYVPHNT